MKFSRPLLQALLTLSLLTACKLGKSGDSQDGSLVLDTGDPLTADTGLTSARPLDSGETFRLGSTYDMLSGERKLSCLDPTKYKLRIVNVHATDSTYSIVSSKEDLARKLDIQVNAEASGSYGAYTGSTSSKVNILKEATFNSRRVMALLTFYHHAQELSVQGETRDVLTAEAQDLLATDSKAFRERCGDVYTKAVTTGAYLYITLTLESKDSFTKDTSSTHAEVSGGTAIAEIFRAKSSTDISKESSQTLSQFRISLGCSSVGMSSDPCAESPANINAEDLNGVVTYIAAAKRAASASISNSSDPSTKKLTAVVEKFQEYPKPLERQDEKLFDIFYDYRERLKLIDTLIGKEGEVNYACNYQKDKSCNEIRTALASHIKYCARQELWADCETDITKISKLVEDVVGRGGGSIVIYEHGGREGRRLTLDFQEFLRNPNGIQPDKIYNLKDFRFASIGSQYDANLKNNYQVRFFEKEDGQGRCYLVKDYFKMGHFGWFNDKAQSFRLEKADSYKAVCD